MMSDLYVNSTLVISESCLTFQVSRSSGPGGQNVNKLNTRVTVILNMVDCPTLTDLQKERIAKKLTGYTDKEGCVQVSSQRYRSQHANRQDALGRLAGLLALAVKPPVKRRKTAAPKAAVRKRLELKKRRSQVKKQRSMRDFDK